MEQFLENHHDTLAFGTLLGFCLVAMLWEALAPRRTETRALAYRWANNLALTALSMLAVRWSGAFVTIVAAAWAEDRGFGLLQQYDLGLAGAFVITLLVMELTGYVLHVIAHRVPLIWRVHAIHHSDVEVDFTTTYRNHPLESVFMALCAAPVVILLGAPVAAMLLFQILRTGTNIISHGNVRISEGIERWLRYLVVTPDFHHLHHSSERRFTDSNYSAVVPWFDFLFGTATRKPYPEYASMELGLERFRDPVDSRLDRMLLLPFLGRRYRDKPSTATNRATGPAAT